MKLTQTLKTRVSDELAARMMRLALKKQGTRRAVSSLSREAALAFVERTEKELGLLPITSAEVAELNEEVGK